MQSIEYKRFPVHLLALFVAAIALVVITLVATGTLFDDSDSDSGRPNAFVQTNTANPVNPAEQMRFLEMNTILPDGGADLGVVGDAPVVQQPAIVSAEQTRFLEMNINLPGTSAPAVVSSEQMRFLEMNIDLPGRSAPPVQLYERTQFLEMNELPGDHTYIPPFPVPSQPGSSLSAY
jgi:hypothetical protein